MTRIAAGDEPIREPFCMVLPLAQPSDSGQIFVIQPLSGTSCIFAGFSVPLHEPVMIAELPVCKDQAMRLQACIQEQGDPALVN